MATAFARMGLWVKISTALGEDPPARAVEYARDMAETLPVCATEYARDMAETSEAQGDLLADFKLRMMSWPTKPPKLAGQFAGSKGEVLVGGWNLHPLFSGVRGSGTRVDMHAVPLKGVPQPGDPDVNVAEALQWINSPRGHAWLAETNVLTYFLVTFDVQV